MEDALHHSNACGATVEALARTRLADCYQCGKCTAGCPVAARMDVKPNQLVRLLQLNRFEEALRAASIWLCVSCQTCSTRCPKLVDCAGVLDALRELALERNLASPEGGRVIAFQRAFLDNIRRNGRLNEIELIAAFKTAVFLRDRSVSFLFKDAGLAPGLQSRRKLHLIGEKSHDRQAVARIFERCANGSRT